MDQSVELAQVIVKRKRTKSIITYVLIASVLSLFAYSSYLHAKLNDIQQEQERRTPAIEKVYNLK